MIRFWYGCHDGDMSAWFPVFLFVVTGSALPAELPYGAEEKQMSYEGLTM